jgi:hypothetical protein
MILLASFIFAPPSAGKEMDRRAPLCIPRLFQSCQGDNCPEIGCVLMAGAPSARSSREGAKAANARK